MPQFLEGRVLEMHVIETDVTARQFHFYVLNVQGIISDVDIGRHPLQRETALLIKGEALDPDVKIVVLEARQRQIGHQIVNGQVISIKLA